MILAHTFALATALSAPFPAPSLVATPSVADVRHVDASIELEVDLLAWRFIDVDADGATELCMAVKTMGGRELRLFDVERTRIVPEPRIVVPVLADVLAFTFADVRPEKGREVVFLTRSGAWSYSLTLEGYRGNIARLVECDLLYDVPDPGALPYWEYVLPSPEGDRLLLPLRSGFTVYGLAADGEANAQRPAYAPISEYDEKVRGFESSDRAQRGGKPRFEIEGGLTAGVLVAEADEQDGNLLASGRSFSAPALLDLDGDGHRDLLRRKDEALFVYQGSAAGLPAVATRTEEFPEYLRREKESLDLRLVDLDGDGDMDLLARWDDEEEGLGNTTITLQILEHEGGRLLPAKPLQVMRFEAAILRVEVTDVDGDRVPDLVVRKFEMPGLMDTVTGLEFTATHLMFPGAGGGQPGFARRPALKHVQTYDEDSFLGAVANRSLRHDCDGDGVADLVEVDVRGRVAIRRLRKTSSRLRGDSWSLDSDPWKRFDVRGDISSLEVRDLNGDGLGDIISRGTRVLTVLLSDDGKRR